MTRCMLFVLIVSAAPLTGQETTYRQGAWASIGLGGALLDIECTLCDASSSTSVGGVLRVGGTISRRWTGAVDLGASFHTEQGSDARALVFSVAASFYPWLDQGAFVNVGIGGIQYDEQQLARDLSVNGVLFRVGAGYDYFVSPKIALTPYVTVWRGTDMTAKANRIVYFAPNLTAYIVQFGLAVTTP